MGLGANAMYVLTPRLNTFLTVQFGWGFSAALGAWTCFGVTGQLEFYRYYVALYRGLCL